MLLFEDHETIVTALAFSPDGSLLASGSRSGSPLIRDSSGSVTPLWPPGPKPVGISNLSFLSNDSLIIGHEAGWELLRRSEGIWPLAIRGEHLGMTGLAVLAPTRLAIGTGNRREAATGAFQLYDLKAAQTVRPVFLESRGVTAVAASPESLTVAWATGGKELKVWDVRRQTPHAVRLSHACAAIALAADGSAAAAVQDWTIRMIDLGTRQDRALMKGHKGIVSCVAFSPDGSTIATGSWDETVRLWEAATGRERAVFQWPVGKVFSLAYAPDGSRLAVGGDRGAVLIWDVE